MSRCKRTHSLIHSLSHWQWVRIWNLKLVLTTTTKNEWKWYSSFTASADDAWWWKYFAQTHALSTHLSMPNAFSLYKFTLRCVFVSRLPILRFSQFNINIRMLYWMHACKMASKKCIRNICMLCDGDLYVKCGSISIFIYLTNCVSEIYHTHTWNINTDG